MSGMRLDLFVAQMARALSNVGIDTARLDARLIARHGLGLDDAQMLVSFDRLLSGAEQTALTDLLARRLEREPIAHILGQWDFWGLPFRVTGETLVPRADSETLVEAILETVPDHNSPIRIVDIGTGSGCLLLALLSELPGSFGVGVDISLPALAVARQNADQLELGVRASFVQGNYADCLQGDVDILLSNPPYLAADEFDDLERDVAAYDPYRALVSGSDGLEAYDAILSRVRGWPVRPRIMAFEIGYRQAGAVSDLAVHYGFARPVCKRDLAGRDRVLIFAPSEGVLD